MKKKYTGQIALIVGTFDGEWGDLVTRLASHPDLRFIPDQAKARVSTMGAGAFDNHYGAAIRADQRRIMRAEKAKA
jgi:hypothetical protein